MEIISFDKKSIENVLSKMDKNQIDNLAFGAIELNKNGDIITYNAAETDITGRQADDVIGKNFFKDVAPCTNTDEFYGKFKEGIENNSLDTMFEYTFDYKMSPTKVKVYMKKALTSDNYWVFVKRIQF